MINYRLAISTSLFFMNSYPFQPSFGEEERAKKPGKPGGKPGKPGNGKPEKPGNGGDWIFKQYLINKNVKDTHR